MNFELTDEQQQLADAVARMLASDYGFEKRQALVRSASGFSDSAWATFAEIGLTALALPEADGGFGGGAMDLMATMEACGDALVVEPLLDTIALGSRLLARVGSAAQRAARLPALADGSQRITLAYLEPGRRYALDPQTTGARRDGEHWVLDGAKSVVIGAPLVHAFIVSARSAESETSLRGAASEMSARGAEGASLYLVDAGSPGLTLNASRTVDGQRCADLHLSGVRLPADALLGAVGGALPHIEEAVDFATALLCADAIGAMRYALDATLEYTKTRKQFGTPIASFQVLQHRMVEMLITLEQARSMAILAAAKVDTSSDARERGRAVSAAKIKIADAARLVSQESVQLHGGMGMSEELKISHTFRRLTMAAQRFGDADHHLRRYAALA